MAHWLQHTSRDGDMQLHVHSQIAHVARTGKDGKWRAPDSLGYGEHVGAVAAITAQHLEEALTARFGLEWAAREDGNGFEIKGIAQEMMDLFSSRRRAITADVRERAARFEERYGRAPSQRELAQLAQASNFATRKGKEGALDLAQAHAGWADRLARTLGVPLASVAPSVWHADAHRAGAAGHAQDADAALARAARRALALAQQEKSAWTRADLVKHLGRILPRTGRDPEAAARLLEETADRILRSEFDPVLCLEAPDPVDLPADLVRADGRSVYRRHGGTRYATRAQLSMEETHGRAGAGRDRAAHDPRGRRSRARRGPRAARARAGRRRGKRRRRRHRFRAARGPGRGRAVGADRRPARVGDQRARPGRARPGSWPRSPRHGRRQASARSSGSPRPSRPATPWPRAGSSPTTAPGSSATSPADAARGATGPSQRAPSWSSTRRR